MSLARPIPPFGIHGIGASAVDPDLTACTTTGRPVERWERTPRPPREVRRG